MSENNKHHRFADETLQGFYDEFNEHREEEKEFQKTVAAAISKNTEAVAKVEEATKGLIEAWNTGKGGVKSIMIFGKFIMWLSLLISAISVIIYTLKNGTLPPTK